MINEPDAPRVRYRYTFRFEDGEEKTFDVELDYATLEMLPPPRASNPDWTALEYHQCPNCPLDPARHPRCPVARNLVDVVETFKDSVSHETAEVEVETEGRKYLKSTSLQQAISSLVGIFMVTSGCPVMSKLRPMVDTHLPFMTASESIYRMISMYLTAQYFLFRMGKKPDWELKEFVAFLQEARDTNAAFCKRLQSIGVKDASLNAISSLNAMGEITRLSLETGDLARWERIFREHYP